MMSWLFKYGLILFRYYSTGSVPFLSPLLLYVIWLLLQKLSAFTGLYTAQKMKFYIKNFFSKCDQTRRKLRIWSYLLKKSLMKNFIFCAVTIIFLFMPKNVPSITSYFLHDCFIFFFNYKKVSYIFNYSFIYFFFCLWDNSGDFKHYWDFMNYVNHDKVDLQHFYDF